jgi:hypothetical protein
MIVSFWTRLFKYVRFVLIASDALACYAVCVVFFNGCDSDKQPHEWTIARNELEAMASQFGLHGKVVHKLGKVVTELNETVDFDVFCRLANK